MAESPPPKPPLLDLYKLAIEEYRFQVKLNWDRTMYYIVFNTATIGVAAGLMKLGQNRLAYILEAAIFIVGFCASMMGSAAVRRGHEYYRRCVVKKTILEDLLGLTSALPDYPHRQTLAIGTTIGQAEHVRIIYDSERWIARRLRARSVSFWLSWFLRLLAILNLVGLVAAVLLSVDYWRSNGTAPSFIIPLVLIA